MPTEFSIDTINEYFTKLNPIATKISHDIDETKSAYEHIWGKLNSNEHNEIINETLMKPEISLRYFDNFSITTSASSLSLSSIVTSTQSEDANKINRQLPHRQNLPTRRFYAFDGRHLSTYAEQKVGLKLVHDEALGTFRDGHSMPFSYKTKSQINLRLLFQEDERVEHLKKDMHVRHTSKQKDQKLPVLENEALETSADTFRKFHTELTTNLSFRPKTELVMSNNVTDNDHDLRPFDKVDTKYKRFYDDEAQTSSSVKQVANHNELNLLKSISKNGKSIVPKFHHSKYGYNGGSGDDDEYERVNLMTNCCSSSAGGMTTSSSSAPSEDDEKTLCEDLKLLLDNDGLHKGFDFLNNW